MRVRLTCFLLLCLVACKREPAVSLIDAVSVNSEEMVSAAIQGGANVEEEGNMGWKPIMVATFKQNSSIVDILLAASASPDAADVMGESALHIACSGSANIVSQLLSAGALPNVQNAGGITPLMLCAGRGNLSAVEALLKAGADSSARDAEGKSATDYADSKGHKTVVSAIGSYASKP